MLNYLYVIIFSFVPEKAIFGRGQVAVTLLALSISSICLSILLWIDYLTNTTYLNIYLFGTIFILPFLYCRWYFLNIKRYRKNLKFYHTKTRWMLRFIGILFLFLSLTSPMINGIILTILKNN
jgi:hypothetical protein